MSNPERKLIEAFLDIDGDYYMCFEADVRQLESDYKDALKAIYLMIIDRDDLHDKNVEFRKVHLVDINRVGTLSILNSELEKKLEKCKEAFIQVVDDVENDPDCDLTQYSYQLVKEALNQFKGDQNEV